VRGWKLGGSWVELGGSWMEAGWTWVRAWVEAGWSWVDLGSCVGGSWVEAGWSWVEAGWKLGGPWFMRGWKLGGSWVELGGSWMEAGWTWVHAWVEAGWSWVESGWKLDGAGWKLGDAPHVVGNLAHMRRMRAWGRGACACVPGVMPVVGFPEEGLPDSSAFQKRASKKCKNDDFSLLPLKIAGFPDPPPPLKPIGSAPFGRPAHRNRIGWYTPGVCV
jgi:hypothetical protein